MSLWTSIAIVMFAVCVVILVGIAGVAWFKASANLDAALKKLTDSL